MKPRYQTLRKLSTTTTTNIQIKPVPILTPPILQTFQKSYFHVSLPCLFPQSHFLPLPAISAWFTPHESLPNAASINTDFFRSILKERTELPVSLESITADKKNFTRISLPFDIFLNYLNISSGPSGLPSLYLAQEPLLQSFPELSKFLEPTPEYVTKAGNGDIYAVNLWLGRAGETNTPLHKDPNPNLFVQLAGRKRVRLFSPELGRELMEIYTGSMERRFRTGDEMMVGEHRDELEAAVWSDGVENGIAEGFEADVGIGDGLFIPKGWWHAIKGVGEGGVVASVNWWFR